MMPPLSVEIKHGHVLDLTMKMKIVMIAIICLRKKCQIYQILSQNRPVWNRSLVVRRKARYPHITVGQILKTMSTGKACLICEERNVKL
jgi:hypothetical protein